MSFGKLGNTFRGETLDQIKAHALDQVRQFDIAMTISDEGQRREVLHRLFENASHNQRAVLTLAAIELLVQYPTKKVSP